MKRGPEAGSGEHLPEEESGEQKVYPQEFIDRCLAELPKKDYGGYEGLKEELERGSSLVTRYLGEKSGTRIDPEDIVEAFQRGDQEKVLEAAKKIIRIKELYREACELWEQADKERVYAKHKESVDR